MRISDWSSDVCSSIFDGLLGIGGGGFEGEGGVVQGVKPRRWGGLGSAHCRRRALRERPFDRLRAGFSRELWLPPLRRQGVRSEEHKSELQLLMRISYAVFCLKKKKETDTIKKAIFLRNQ